MNLWWTIVWTEIPHCGGAESHTIYEVLASNEI